jgi:hypothetical protein
MQQINRIGQNLISISIVAEETFDKFQPPLRIKALKKLRIEGLYLNIVKAI